MIIDNALYVDISVASETEVVDITVSDGSGGRLPNYEGEYTVTPRKREIVLPTKNKSMMDDVTVFQIPYSEVSNPQGGITATIGLE